MGPKAKEQQFMTYLTPCKVASTIKLFHFLHQMPRKKLEKTKSLRITRHSTNSSKHQSNHKILPSSKFKSIQSVTVTPYFLPNQNFKKKKQKHNSYTNYFLSKAHHSNLTTTKPHGKNQIQPDMINQKGFLQLLQTTIQSLKKQNYTNCFPSSTPNKTKREQEKPHHAQIKL